ncbi:hypothetical protein [Sediminicoccus sp. KRV36]|uniref:hypothetical protein n=1 Tax=Sediminicoccus sp. KRV36 TaxID=3133721 RepID=UPI00200FF89C|nr:hypothetical protein [Sediminicoccus rosea]UPY37273.1 hypothetical protein LHU95_00870 [Sediminicoccus rosea]
MTHPRKLASLEAGQVLFDPGADRRARGRILRQGFAILALGAALTWLAVAFANAPLGLLSLAMVLGGLGWTSIRLLVNFATRFRARARQR